MPNRTDAKKALDAVIKKSRVHLYKPIQIAEILYRDRVFHDINLLNRCVYYTIYGCFYNNFHTILTFLILL